MKYDYSMKYAEKLEEQKYQEIYQTKQGMHEQEREKYNTEREREIVKKLWGAIEMDLVFLIKFDGSKIKDQVIQTFYLLSFQPVKINKPFCFLYCCQFNLSNLIHILKRYLI